MLPTPNGSLGRDLASGRFTAGNPGGPGNPYARRVAAMRTQLLDAVDSDGIAEVARAMLAAAKAGDTAAARLVLSYALGPPLAAADPDRLDANELEALRSRPNMFDRLALSNLTPEPMSLFRDEGGSGRASCSGGSEGTPAALSRDVECGA